MYGVVQDDPQDSVMRINGKWILGKAHVWADHTDVEFSLVMVNLMFEAPKEHRDIQCVTENRGNQRSHKNTEQSQEIQRLKREEKFNLAKIMYNPHGIYWVKMQKS